MYRYFFAPLLLSALALARPQTPADTSALAGLPACAVRSISGEAAIYVMLTYRTPARRSIFGFSILWLCSHRQELYL